MTVSELLQELAGLNGDRPVDVQCKGSAQADSVKIDEVVAIRGHAVVLVPACDLLVEGDLEEAQDRIAELEAEITELETRLEEEEEARK